MYTCSATNNNINVYVCGRELTFKFGVFLWLWVNEIILSAMKILTLHCCSNTETLISVSVIVVNFCTNSGIRDKHALSSISSQSLLSYQRGELTISHNYCIIT